MPLFYKFLSFFTVNDVPNLNERTKRSREMEISRCLHGAQLF